MKKQYLNTEEYLPLAPETEGQVHVNHDECEAGRDTKKRLYIRRLEDGTVLAYCHHCSKSGRYIPSAFKIRKSVVSSTSTSKEPARDSTSSKLTVSLPSDYEPDPREWPVQARAWCYKGGLTDEDIKFGRLGYSDFYKRIILPAFDADGITMYQLRRIFDTDTKPKYISYGMGKSSLLVLDRSKCMGSVAIVEDVLSGVRVSKFTPALVLLGSHLHDKHIEYILSNKINNIYIFLDNDNPIIKSKALTMKQKLDMIVDKVTITKTDKDPKEYSDKELQEILND